MICVCIYRSCSLSSEGIRVMGSGAVSGGGNTTGTCTTDACDEERLNGLTRPEADSEGTARESIEGWGDAGLLGGGELLSALSDVFSAKGFARWRRAGGVLVPVASAPGGGRITGGWRRLGDIGRTFADELDRLVGIIEEFDSVSCPILCVRSNGALSCMRGVPVDIILWGRSSTRAAAADGFSFSRCVYSETGRRGGSAEEEETESDNCDKLESSGAGLYIRKLKQNQR